MNSFSDVVFMNCFNDEEWKKKHGVIPVISKDGKTITYGLYPQTVVSDSALIEKLNQLTAPESNGWYFYNGDFYEKLVAKSVRYGLSSDYYKFNNGAAIIAGKIYWFKVEPITWDVLYKNDDEYFILSSALLDAHRYGDSHYYSGSYNYKDSDIRAWLNNDFYYSAFALGNKYIQTTTVHNYDSSDPYACEDTEDKVFLPSHDEYYGAIFYGPLDAFVESTDYARANGVSHNDDTFDRHNDRHWIRSPSIDDRDCAMCAYAGGMKFLQIYVEEETGVRPCLNIKIA